MHEPDDQNTKIFAELNEEIEGVVDCANITESKLCGRGRSVFCVKDSEGYARNKSGVAGCSVRAGVQHKPSVRDAIEDSRGGDSFRRGKLLTTSDGLKFH